MNNFIILLILILVIFYFLDKKEKFLLLKDESKCALITDMQLCTEDNDCTIRDDLYKGNVCMSKVHNQAIENALNGICPY